MTQAGESGAAKARGADAAPAGADGDRGADLRDGGQADPGDAAVGTLVRDEPEESAAAAGRSRPRKTRRRQQAAPGEKRWVAAIFLFPAAVFLGVIVLYPLVYTVIRSFLKDGPAGTAGGFAGFDNYTEIFTSADSFRALKNNLIWVLIVPALIAVLGLFFAVLSERIRWSSAFKIVLFMPMAISFLASGVTWALIYVDQPSQGLGNAVVTGVHDIFRPSTGFPNAHPADASVLTGDKSSGYTSIASFSAGTPAQLPLVGLDLQNPPAEARQAQLPSGGDGLAGVVWNDFKLGGGGQQKAIDDGEIGIPGLTVQALRNGEVVASTTTAGDGTFRFDSLTDGEYQLKLPASNFREPFNGIAWLGKTWITPSIILAYIWIYAGFAMVLLAAGMSAIPRDALEAARMDGATEWQVFRRVTAPLLMPVLLVVLVTMIINVLKIFDLVFVIQQSAGANAKYANVLATQLYADYGNQLYGAASAVGVVLVLLVIPAMIFQVRQYRKDQR